MATALIFFGQPSACARQTGLGLGFFLAAPRAASTLKLGSPNPQPVRSSTPAAPARRARVRRRRCPAPSSRPQGRAQAPRRIASRTPPLSRPHACRTARARARACPSFLRVSAYTMGMSHASACPCSSASCASSCARSSSCSMLGASTTQRALRARTAFCTSLRAREPRSGPARARCGAVPPRLPLAGRAHACCCLPHVRLLTWHGRGLQDLQQGSAAGRPFGPHCRALNPPTPMPCDTACPAARMSDNAALLACKQGALGRPLPRAGAPQARHNALVAAALQRVHGARTLLPQLQLLQQLVRDAVQLRGDYLRRARAAPVTTRSRAACAHARRQARRPAGQAHDWGPVQP